MPIFSHCIPSRRGFVECLQSVLSIGLSQSTPNRLHIGLVNSMPDGALEATERQFVNLLHSAAGDFVVNLSFYALPDVPRKAPGRQHVSRFYADIENLWNAHLDGLIVTGTEPSSPNLAEEPYWGSLKKVVEWAEHNTHSTIWSCLAAHAAVLHMDGITRHPLGEKRFGVFKCTRASDHRLTASTPPSFDIPHSRWNDIHETELGESGYRVLTRASDGGVDTFVKKKKNLFLFFQGHPEYEADTLLLEYRRDVRRFLLGKRNTYPTIPQGCLGREATSTLRALAERAISCPSEELLTAVTNTLEKTNIVNSWRPVALRIYTNWLMSLSAMKELRQRPVAASSATGLVDQAP